LSPEVLEEVRLLSNFEMADQKLLQIVLCGQKELEVTLDRPELWQLKQRVAFWMTIQPLGAVDVSRYIQHRWKTAGGSLPAPFREDAIELIAAASRGIPRVMNVICDKALTSGFADGARAITVNYIVKTCRELRLNENARSAPVAKTDSAAGPPQVTFDGPPLRTLYRYDPASKSASRWSRWFRKPMISVATTENL